MRGLTLPIKLLRAYTNTSQIKNKRPKGKLKVSGCWNNCTRGAALETTSLPKRETYCDDCGESEVVRQKKAGSHKAVTELPVAHAPKVQRTKIASMNGSQDR
jgi:hypothetical protein